MTKHEYAESKRITHFYCPECDTEYTIEEVGYDDNNGMFFCLKDGYEIETMTDEEYEEQELEALRNRPSDREWREM